MSGFLLRLKTWWQTADRTQRTVTLGGGGLLVVLLIAVYFFASKPKMSLVFANLSPADAGSVALEIENLGIPVTFDGGGNVQVPSDQVAKVRASLAMNGKLPKGANNYASDQLKDLPMFTTQGVERERLNAIKEGELSQAIEFFEGVDQASVKITPAVDSPFEAEKKSAQANVTVSEQGGASVTDDQARAMANLVASAVPGLDKGHVTIFTRTGRALWDGQNQQDSTAQANNRLDLERAEAKKKKEVLQSALDRMLGPGNAIAMVDLALDTSKITQTAEHHPGKLIPATQIDETMTQGGGSAPIPAGVGANDPGAPVADLGGGGAGAGSAGYSVKQKQNDPAIWTDTVHETIEKALGDVKSMSITVLVNKTDKITVDPNNPDDPVVKMANSALPPHDAAQNANFTASVVSYPFDTSQSEAAKKAEDAAAGSARFQQILSILPIAALILAAILVLKAVGKLAARPPRPMAMLATADGPALPYPMSPGGTALPAANELTKALSAANSFVLPEVVKQKALEAGITEEQLQAAIEEAGEAGISVDDIPSIKSRVNVPLEQIKKMATERPESVAMLIKSWIIEEGIRR